MGTDQPNILIVHTDQQSWWTLSGYGGTVVDTPNIDRLAAEGAIFSNFFTNSAVCTPSRGCFVTGRYPHCHGAYTNNIPLNRDEITFAEVLKRRGYKTGYAGKWHLDGTPRPGWVHPERTMGFEHAEFMFNRGHWKKIEDGPMGDTQPTVYPYDILGDETTYTTDWLTAKALHFIDAREGEPFCFMLSLPDPHGPVDVRSPYDAMFRPEDMAIPNTFTDDALPDWAAALQANSPFGMGRPGREEQLRRFLALYFGEVKLIDDSVGRLMTALEARGLLDNTLVVFTTDHGEYGGEHGLHGKNHLYETAYRIPLLMRLPGRIPAGLRVDNVLSTVDFQPTILALLGFSACGREQGRDASCLLQDDGAATWDDVVFIHHSSHQMAAIFTRDFELGLVNGGDGILFDRHRDPDQMRNLFRDPGFRGIVRTLTHRIVEHHVALQSPAAAWLKDVEWSACPKSIMG